MSYTKPQISKLDGAIKAIQAGDEKGDFAADGTNQPPNQATANAYEADE